MKGLEGHVMIFEYPVVIHQEQGSVWVSCPAVPEMACAGDTVEEAMFDAVDALESALSFYVDQKQAIPLPATPTAGQPVVRLPALTAAKAALWNTMVAQKISKTEMARRLGVNRPQVDRLIDLLHRSKIEQVEHALHMLGQRIELSVVAV